MNYNNPILKMRMYQELFQRWSMAGSFLYSWYYAYDKKNMICEYLQHDRWKENDCQKWHQYFSLSVRSGRSHRPETFGIGRCLAEITSSSVLSLFSLRRSTSIQWSTSSTQRSMLDTAKSLSPGTDKKKLRIISIKMITANSWYLSVIYPRRKTSFLKCAAKSS